MIRKITSFVSKEGLFLPSLECGHYYRPLRKIKKEVFCHTCNRLNAPPDEKKVINLKYRINSEENRGIKKVPKMRREGLDEMVDFDRYEDDL